MDIQEIMKYSKNKIEADDLTKQVRRRIKETAWEKQNHREGFRETFKPLISQFEKPKDSEKENIFTQNQKILQNQLALTSGQENQKAITNKKELPAIEYAVDDDDNVDDDDDDDDDDYNYKSDDFYSDNKEEIKKKNKKNKMKKKLKKNSI